MVQRCLHVLHLADADFQRLDLLPGQVPDIGAGPAPVAPQRQQIGDFFHRKAQVARAPDKAQDLDVLGAVGAIARSGAPDLRDQAGLFVIAHHLGRHATGAGGFTDGHHVRSP